MNFSLRLSFLLFSLGVFSPVQAMKLEVVKSTKQKATSTTSNQNRHSSLSVSDDEKEEAKSLSSEEQEQKNSISDDNLTLKTLSIPKTLRDMRHHPSPYELAVLNAHAYLNDIENDTTVAYTVPQQNDKPRKTHTLKDWKVHQTLHVKDKKSLLSQCLKKLGNKQGYIGRLYHHPQKKQIVWVHRGTDPKNLSALKTDVKDIALNIIQGQERLLPDLLGVVVETAKEKKATLIVTGHSLGGWLAQLTTLIFRGQYRDYPRIPCITFDTPGAKDMLDQIKANIEIPDLNKDFDITNYLSSPNLINTCNSHIGTCYRVVFDSFTSLEKYYFLQSHAIDNFVRAFDPKTGVPNHCIKIHSWPLLCIKAFTETLSRESIKGKIMVFFLKRMIEIPKKGKNLDEYSCFFKFAKKTNHYNPKPEDLKGTAKFDLQYQYHYQTERYQTDRINVRHLTKPLKNFLKAYPASQAHQALFPYSCIFDEDTSSYIFKSKKKGTKLPHVLLLIDYLHALSKQKPKFFQPSSRSKTTTLYHNIPPTFVYSVTREVPLKLLAKSFALDDPDATEDLCMAPPITGPGGIGKTQLALQFIHKYKTRYDRIVWLAAQDTDTLNTRLLTLADTLAIQNRNPKKRLKPLFLKLQKERVLYILDGAPNYKTIKPCLPEKGHLIITSRNSNKADWIISPIVLTLFSKDEIHTLLGSFGYESSHPLYKSELLPRYPLALVHLLSTFQNLGYTSKECTALLSSKRETYALLQVSPNEQVGYEKTLISVLEQSLKALQKAGQGVLALYLLRHLAYLDVQQVIPCSWVLTWLLPTKDKTNYPKRALRQALCLLETYSLLQWERSSGNLYLYPLIQQVVCNRHALKCLAPLTNSLFAYTKEKHINFITQKQRYAKLFPHAEKFYQHLNHLNIIHSKTDYFPYFVTTASFLYNAYNACDTSVMTYASYIWATRSLIITQQRYPDQDHPSIANSYNNLGFFYSKQSAYQKAINYYKKALTMRLRLYPNQDHPDIIISFNNLGFSYSQLSKVNLLYAKMYYQKALDMRLRLYDNQDHPDIITSYENLGNICETLDEPDEGNIYYRHKALDMRLRLYPNQDLKGSVFSYQMIAISYHNLEKSAEAIQCCNQALCLYSDRNHPNLAWIYSVLGTIYGFQDKKDKSIKNFELALTIACKQPKDKVDLIVIKCLSTVFIGALRNIKDSIRVEAIKKRLLPICKKALGAEHELVVQLAPAKPTTISVEKKKNESSCILM